MKQLHCPTCSKKFEQENTDAMPFCSERCRLIDLGRWLDEEHTADSVTRQEPGQGTK